MRSETGVGPSPPGRSGRSYRLPFSEEGRGSLEQIALLAQRSVLAPQPGDLFALVSVDAVVGLVAIDLVLATPVAQRLRRDAQALRKLAGLRP